MKSTITISLIAQALFFFSSRRRHTRSTRDWSSDVCSSDLSRKPVGSGMLRLVWNSSAAPEEPLFASMPLFKFRSEERRVGKECRSRWWQDQLKKITEIRTGVRKLNGRDNSGHET